MAAQPTDQILVLVGHLHEVSRALDAAYGLSMADDIGRQLHNLQPTVRKSKLTTLLEQQLLRFESYVEEADRIADASGDEDE